MKRHRSASFARPSRDRPATASLYSARDSWRHQRSEGDSLGERGGAGEESEGGSPSPRPSPPGRGRTSGRCLKARGPRLHPSRCCPSAQKARQHPGAAVSTLTPAPLLGEDGPPSPRRLRRAGRGEGERVIQSCGSAPAAQALLHAQLSIAVDLREHSRHTFSNT